jgi:hypothetical protein
MSRCVRIRRRSSGGRVERERVVGGVDISIMGLF